MTSKKLKGWTRVIVFLSALLMIGVFFLPMWRIELSAPQYPEGLVLQIFPDKLGGDVDVVNGLNHYIGMKTLHSEDFPEFKILPYCILFFAVLILVTAFLNRKKLLYVTAGLFILFSIISMIDFWKWEYNYGHELNPEAPIQVPGMTYQPPLIGYKQLLNFGAYSIPDAGGWLFVSVGILLALTVFIEIRHAKKDAKKDFSRPGIMIVLLFMSIFFSSCAQGPQPIQLGKDACSYCKMTIADPRFGGEIITAKGKAYKFDDMHCLLSFTGEGQVARGDIKEMYVVDYNSNHGLIKADENLLMYKSDLLHSPMGGNIAGFSSRDSLAVIMKKFNGYVLNWDALIK
ncbi:MAG TPA: nitrous oxide reductase accessory protein NosL [Parafilimonas sp.]|nr:nitrous oxide reductase accessory protein NosL [Parafilimonas sp.]